MLKSRLIATAFTVAIAFGATPVSAATTFTTNFDSYAQCNGCWTVVQNVEGWTTLSGAGIELQHNAAGAPQSGINLVELDSYNNSAMGRTVSAGNYVLNFFYSPRPGVGSASNIIDVKIGDTLLGSITGNGREQTNWTNYTYNFNIGSAQTLSFAARGTNDSLGGYIDTVSLQSAVPEPHSWMMMIFGFGAVGAALRRQRKLATACA